MKVPPGELYVAFTPELIAARRRCHHACETYNATPSDSPRRKFVSLWRSIIQDPTPLPPELPDPAADEAQFVADPWIEPPIRIDYGSNVHIGPNTFINFNAVFVDTCDITIGARTLVGPYVNFYSGTHPIDPAVRNGLTGPEMGWEIHVEEDVWIGGNVSVCPGVTIGRGSTVGAGSVVTKDVPPFHVVAGNPAKILRKIDTEMDPDRGKEEAPDGLPNVLSPS